MVGYDASDCARAALGSAVEVAGAFGDEVHVVVVYEVSRLGGEVADFAAALRERAQHVGELARDQASGLHAEVTVEVEEGPIAEAIATVAERLDARMIVVGTRGEGPLRGALIGSTPHRLIQQTSRPVLVVPG